MPEQKQAVETLEKGNVYFFYRPKVGEEAPESIEDVQRVYMILSPDGEEKYRTAVIGKKKLPDPSKSGRGRFWGFIETVRKSPKTIRDELGEEKYGTKTRGERTLPASRPAGEGRYRIVRHEDHTHFAYAIELPAEQGEVQEQMNIEPEASYIISVKNPEAGQPPYAGLSEQQQAEFPKRLQEKFRGRKFSELDPPEFLNYEGAEFVLIAASDDIEEELGVRLDVHDEDARSADIFNDLKLDKSEQPTKPMFEGEWE